MTAVLEFRDVTRAFGAAAPVLDGVSFAMQREEIVGLLGRNGAGKTTLIRIAMGMLFPHGGHVKVFGLSPMTEPVAVKRRVGYVAEDQVLPPSARIAELLAFHRSLFPTWDDALERQLLDRFGLADRSRKIRVLSKGQARQVALVLAVCHRPELLILDEPAGGLDPAARREFLETSIQLLNREGTSILFSSHHMGDVERLGGRVVLLAPNEATHGEWAKVLNVPVVVEILSPSTARYDRFGKRVIYREVGVETFWIIDANTCVVEEWTPRAISARLLTTYATCSDFRRSVRPVTASH